jgi:hypothetical protein
MVKTWDRILLNPDIPKEDLDRIIRTNTKRSQIKTQKLKGGGFRIQNI